ncbi:hypothetical protein LPJ53_003173 [Coemansia erecta]|uniref:Cation/H+ exchanger transmembrane domain-containing protein n=1 Tax=Coemansia erecta TaxID=147472 RepID=A0A9W7XWS6_9FUNG|nr:hypothetical protein LPJ53_003173 [Coemansia erecta]
MAEISAHTGQPQIAPALLGGFLLLLALCSRFVRARLYLAETLLAMTLGILVGPSVLSWADPAEWSSAPQQLTQEFSHYCLAIEVMLAGVTLPARYMLTECKSLATLLLPIMTLTWLVSAAIIKFVFVLPFLQALAIGACVTPTDPVLAYAIVTGRFAESRLPRRLRTMLVAESGANDGFGYPFLFFALYLMRFSSGAKAIGTWVYATWVYQILLSVAIGLVAGYLGRKLLRYAHQHDLIEPDMLVVTPTALALFLVGVCTLIGTDDILCCFVAGNTLNWDAWYHETTQGSTVQETINYLMTLGFFMYFGATIPWSQYTGTNGLDAWRIIVTIILVIGIRRLPAFVLLKRLVPAVCSWTDVLAAGWFGPIGVSAVFYALEAVKQIDEHGDSNAGRSARILIPIAWAIVFGSVLLHGLTVPVLLIVEHIAHMMTGKRRREGKTDGLNIESSPETIDESQDHVLSK